MAKKKKKIWETNIFGNRSPEKIAPKQGKLSGKDKTLQERYNKLKNK